MVAQMAERVTADPRVCSLNPAKDPMVFASIKSKQHVAINNHEVPEYYKPVSRIGLPPSNGIHLFENLFLSWLIRLRAHPPPPPPASCRRDEWGPFEDTGDQQVTLGTQLWTLSHIMEQTVEILHGAI